MDPETPQSPRRLASATLALAAAVVFVATAAALSFLPEHTPADGWRLRGALDATRPLPAAAKPV